MEAEDTLFSPAPMEVSDTSYSAAAAEDGDTFYSPASNEHEDAFYLPALIEQDDFLAYDARAVSPSAAVDSLLVTADFDSEFPSLAEQRTTIGFRIALAQVQKQNFVTQDIDYDRRLPLGKWLYNAHRDQRVSLRKNLCAEKLYFEQRRLRRDQLRKAALKSHESSDIARMIVEWGGEFNSAISLPPMALPGERYVLLEDIWSSERRETWSEERLAQFRLRPKPEKTYGEEVKVGFRDARDQDVDTNDLFAVNQYYGLKPAVDNGKYPGCNIASTAPNRVVTPQQMAPLNCQPRPTQSLPTALNEFGKRARSDGPSHYTYTNIAPKRQQVANAAAPHLRQTLLMAQTFTQSQQRPRTVLPAPAAPPNLRAKPPAQAARQPQPPVCHDGVFRHYKP